MYITVNNLNKTFKITKKQKGVVNSLKSFFKRQYIYVEAVKNVNFNIKKGEIIGYIGPNGAGKSTTIKMLSGILTPDNGECLVDGMVPWLEREKYVSKIGVVFGQRSQLMWDIPVIDTFYLLKEIYKISDSTFEVTKNNLISRLNLNDIVDVPVRQLSLGQRMRCEIAASLIHKPDILFLDEPTIGLDAISKKIVREFIKELNKKDQVTVILTTHDMNDIEELAKRIILIGKGTILYDGSLKKLKEKYNNLKYVTINSSGKLSKINKKGIVKYNKIDMGYYFIIDSNLLSISNFLKYMSDKIEITDIEIDQEKIDDIIIKLYEEHQI